MNCVGSSEYMTVFTSFTRASFLNMRADQSFSPFDLRLRMFLRILIFDPN